jgi:hypothetical protein
MVLWGLVRLRAGLRIPISQRKPAADRALIPELFILQGPLRHFPQRFRRKRKHFRASATSAAHESGALENAHVLAEASERHGEGSGNVRNGRRSARKPRQNRSPRRIGNRRRDQIESLRSFTLNHMLQYPRNATRCFGSTLDVDTQPVTPAKHAAQAAVMSRLFSSDKDGPALVAG